MKRAEVSKSASRNGSLLAMALAAAALGLAGKARAENPIATAIPGEPTLPIGAYDIKDLGYTITEFELSGIARSFRLTSARTADGNWRVARDATAPYKTRIVVIRPANARKFNGTVIVEWLNVSGGLDVPVDWTTLHREIVRDGYAYVAVSAQKVGVEGGPNLGRGTAAPLKKVDPARYGSLSHPGDAFSFDIYSDVGRLLRGRQAGLALGGLKPRRLIAVGESQSAFYLATYVNAVDPLARIFDGYLIHSRSAVAAPLDGAPMLGGSPELLQAPVKLRQDLRVPTMQVLTETDIAGLAGSIGFHAARQPDTAKLRTWEIAGTAHADNYLFKVGGIDTGLIPVEKLAAAWRPMDNLQGLRLPVPMNNGPQHHYVVEAALDHLVKWVRDRKVPPSFPPVALEPGTPPTFEMDGNGLASGGVRTPWVDVPTSVLSGIGAAPMVPLIGTSKSFDQATLDRLYVGGRSDYLGEFTASLDEAIARGVILYADREEIIELARLGYQGSK